MNSHYIKKFLFKYSCIGKPVFWIFRLKITINYLCWVFKESWNWLLTSNETTNFTYELEEKNKKYLASLLSFIFDIKISEIFKYIEELENNKNLINHIQDSSKNHCRRLISDTNVKFGRKLSWYIITRILKPKIIVETGIDKGLGGCVLIEALMKNEEEGYLGQYFGTDINPDAGYLISEKYTKYATIFYGDSIESLRNFSKSIDLFINDSNHDPNYEEEEYKVIESKLSETSIILGDNCEITDKLLSFSQEKNRSFVFFQEKPLKHWYPGGGIGISFKRRSSQELI